MNKYLKHLLWLGLLGCASSVIANDSNPNSAGYHARHNASSVYYQGPNGAANQPQQSAPQPTGHWVKTWGAIVKSDTGGALGTAEGFDSKKEAEEKALADCKAQGGGGCEVALSYFNQCAAMVIGDKSYSMYSAAGKERATEIGMNDCKKKNSSKSCHVYYSACTEPRFVKY